MVEPGMVFEDPYEVTEVIATPDETGDRYQVRLTVPPGGGPGIRGLGPHVHPRLTEFFRCVSGTMTTRVGRNLSPLPPGEQLEVPPGVVHGFKNTGKKLLVVDVDMVFTPPGPRPEADMMAVGLVIHELVRNGEVSRRTGHPPLLHLAVIAASYPEAIKWTGLAGIVMPALVALGRLRGYQPNVSNRITRR